MFEIFLVMISLRDILGDCMLSIGEFVGYEEWRGGK